MNDYERNMKLIAGISLRLFEVKINILQILPLLNLFILIS